MINKLDKFQYSTIKFIVVFFGILILVGIISLGFAVYHKINNLSNTYANPGLSIERPNNMEFVDYKIHEDKVSILYKNEKILLIKIIDLKNGREIKEIQILK